MMNYVLQNIQYKKIKWSWERENMIAIGNAHDKMYWDCIQQSNFFQILMLACTGHKTDEKRINDWETDGKQMRNRWETSNWMRNV